MSLLAASVSHWLRKVAVDVPHVLVATNFHSLLQLGLLPSSGFLSLLVLRAAPMSLHSHRPKHFVNDH